MSDDMTFCTCKFTRQGASGNKQEYQIANSPVTDWQSLAVSTVWQGPILRKRNQFYGHVGADAGLRQHGEKQDWSGLFSSRYLPPVWIPRIAHMARSNNGVTGKFNASTANLAIPAVYVPTAAINWYGGRATQ
jgi:hypothetical protein